MVPRPQQSLHGQWLPKCLRWSRWDVGSRQGEGAGVALLEDRPPPHTLPLPLHRPPNSRGPILCVTFPLSCPHWQIHIQLPGAGQGTEVLLSPVGAADAGGLYTARCIATGKSLKLGVVFTHRLQRSRDSLSP